MIYQLVLITNLGVMTPLATFTDRIDCLKEAAFVQKSAQYSAACLPTDSPDKIIKQNEAAMKQLMEMINRIAKEQK